MRKPKPEDLLPQYDGPLTPRMQFEDTLGDLVQAAARYGKRSGKPYEEIDSWERSPAGRLIAFTTHGPVQATSAELAIESPSDFLLVMTATHGGFINQVDLSTIESVSFTMYEPQVAADNNEPEVRAHIHLADQSFGRDLTYEQFIEICRESGVYTQEHLQVRQRMANWVLAHTVNRDNYDARDWK